MGLIFDSRQLSQMILQKYFYLFSPLQTKACKGIKRKFLASATSHSVAVVSFFNSCLRFFA
jgi:hypothetical protein